MALKKKTENATITYDPEMVSEDTRVTFTKISNAKGVTIYGKIEKDGAEVGSISYEQEGNYLITSLKPFNSLTDEEAAAILNSTLGWIGEVLEN